jgi:hypothetical protein
MADIEEEENIKYNYRLIDLTELNLEMFLQSDVPEEIIMAILAGKTRHEGKRSNQENII